MLILISATSAVGQKLSGFIERYGGTSYNAAKAVQIALIDNGVIGFDREGLPPIHFGRGRSFVFNGGIESLWDYPRDPHGTQMSNLICSIDPRCRIYVAKVCDGMHDITTERVIQVKTRQDVSSCNGLK